MGSFAVQTHTAKDQTVKHGNSHPQEVENPQTGSDHCKTVSEVCAVCLVPKNIGNGAAEESQSGVEPEGAIAIYFIKYMS